MWAGTRKGGKKSKTLGCWRDVQCAPQKFIQAVVSRLRLAATDLVLPVYVANDSESRGASCGVTVRSFLLAVKVSTGTERI